MYQQRQDIFQGDFHPLINRNSWETYGLLGGHFFGYMIPYIAMMIEHLPNAAASALAKNRNHRYKFAHALPSSAEVEDARHHLLHVQDTHHAASDSSGCARIDGWKPLHLKIVLPRRARKSSKSALSKGADEDTEAERKKNEVLSKELPLAMQYRELRRRPFDDVLLVKKSRIHGWGLFVKEAIGKDSMIVEYQGQMIRQKVADEREKCYEEMGIGSCYMFRLDSSTIVDATRIGNLARFINHSCTPNAYAKVVTVDGNEKKIIIFAQKALGVDDEVTYDYKFPMEDEALRCDCGAINCIGRMN